MIEQLLRPAIATALDAIIERFGVDQVAEVTGRTRRLIVGRDGCQKLQSRSPRANVVGDAFMDGAKRILVFSDAGDGRSYHADPPPGTRRGGSISCWSRDGGPMPRSRASDGPTTQPGFGAAVPSGDDRRARRAAVHLDDRPAARQPRRADPRGSVRPAGRTSSIPPTISRAPTPRRRSRRWFGLLFTGKLEAVT